MFFLCIATIFVSISVKQKHKWEKECVREFVLSSVGREGGTCKRQMVTQWSCSPTPSLFLTPFWVLHPFPVTSPESYLICFFFHSPLISIFYRPVRPSLHLHLHQLKKSELRSLCCTFSLQTLFFPCQVFCWTNQLENTKRFFLWLSFWPPADTTRRTAKRFGICGGNKKTRKSDRKTMIDSYGQWRILNILSVLSHPLVLLLLGCILMYFSLYQSKPHIVSL